MCGVSHLNWLTTRQWNDTFFPLIRSLNLCASGRRNTQQNGIDLYQKRCVHIITAIAKIYFCIPKKERDVIYLCVLITSTKKLVVNFRPTILFVTRIPSSNILSLARKVTYCIIYNCSFPWISLTLPWMNGSWGDFYSCINLNTIWVVLWFNRRQREMQKTILSWGNQKSFLELFRWCVYTLTLFVSIVYVTRAGIVAGLSTHTHTRTKNLNALWSHE